MSNFPVFVDVQKIAFFLAFVVWFFYHDTINKDTEQ